MISYIKGKLMQVAQNFVVVDHQGMGISVFVPTSMMARLSPVGEEIFLHTYFRVGEDGMQLYGFLEDKDLEIFKQLIAVSGIGPKGALGVLSALSSDDLRIAILSGDAKAIAKAPGVGIKTAQRVIIDLKEKVKFEDGTHLANDKEEKNNVSADAISALVSLGYSLSDATRAVHCVVKTKEMKVEDVIKMALRNLIG